MMLHDTVSIIVEKEGKMLLVRRKNRPEKGCWAVPGGHVDKGESAYKAAVRECREEVGEIAVANKKRFVFIHDVDIGHRHRAHVFSGTSGTSGTPGTPGKLRAGSDAERLGWFSLSQMKRMNITHYTKYIVNRLHERSL